jgi:Putative Flp pilus-assembly TadE/G-like
MGARPRVGRLGDEGIRASRERGSILVLFAVMLPLLIVCCTIAIDVGYWWVVAKRTQVAADACALAAAQELPHAYNDVSNCVVEPNQSDYVLVNLPDQSAPDPMPQHLGTRLRSPYGGDPNLVEATVRMRVETFFGRYVGLGFVEVERRAVAEREPPAGQQAIYADSTDCGFSLKFNGEKQNIQGGIHGNGAWEQNGADFTAGSATYVQGCPTPHPKLTSGETTFGEGPTQVPEQDWPEWFKRSDFTCTVGNPSTNMQISADFTVLNGTYCANEFTISGRQITGTITVVANRITINNRDHTFSPREHGVLFFTPPNSTPTPPNNDDEQANYVCNPNPALEMILNGENYHWEGIIMSPCGRIKFNGQDAVAGTSLLTGHIIAKEVEINGANFNMIGTGTPTGDFVLALNE